jgi:hypothetical protein
MMKSKRLSISLLVRITLLIVISFAVVTSGYATAAQLTAPSTSMKGYEGRGFTVSLPSNWIMDTFPFGMSYCAATDGKRVTKDAEGTNVTVLQGLAAGYKKTTSSNAKTVADETIRSLQKDNPGLRVIRRTAKKLDGFPAESLLFESATGRGGELERSWMLIAVKGSQLFMAVFTSPARDYDQLQTVFVEIAGSIRLTAWQKGTAAVPMKR